ncbi:MAG: hypothetical protein FWD16_05375, partial [Clostridia bacterium]|nr:hypothetical protein [Clostridia bacterium]
MKLPNIARVLLLALVLTLIPLSLPAPQAAQTGPIYFPEMLKFQYAEDSAEVLAELEAEEPNLRNPKLWQAQAWNNPGCFLEYIVAPREGLDVIGNGTLPSDPRWGVTVTGIEKIMADPEGYNLSAPGGALPTLMAIVRIARYDMASVAKGPLWTTGGAFQNTIRFHDDIDVSKVRVSIREGTDAFVKCNWWASDGYSRNEMANNINFGMWHPRTWNDAWAAPGLCLIIGYYGEITDAIKEIPFRGRTTSRTCVTTLQAEGNGTVSGVSDPDDCSLAETPDGPTVYSFADSEVKITATPDEGWRFKEWVVVSGEATLDDKDSAETTFTRDEDYEGPVTIKAIFELIPVVTETPTPTLGVTPPPTNQNTVTGTAPGETPTATPNPYKLGDINCDNFVNIDDILLVRD